MMFNRGEIASETAIVGEVDKKPGLGAVLISGMDPGRLMAVKGPQEPFSSPRPPAPVYIYHEYY